MAFTYGFYNSKNKDRRYNADQMSQLFDGILNDGVFNKVGELMMVVPGTGLQVLVKSGRAWFNSTWSYNDAAYPLNLSTPDVAVPRIDAVVLEVDHTETVRANRLLVVKGIASSNPEKPTLTNTDLIHQHPLAYVTLNPGAESISSGDIEIMVGKDECPFVTGILETASLEDLFASWDEQFTTWFDDVKSQLEGDVATNLLNMINERVKIADKASTSEVTAGTNDTKWVTPKGVAAIAGKVKDPSSGSYFSPTLSLVEITPTSRAFANTDGASPRLYDGASSRYVSMALDTSNKTIKFVQWSNGTGKISGSSTNIGTYTEASTMSLETNFNWEASDTTNYGFASKKVNAPYILMSASKKKAIIIDTSNSIDFYIANSYYGWLESNYLRYIDANTNSLTGNAISNSITHTMYNKGIWSIFGVYNNMVWVGQVYSSDLQQLLIHKFDLNAKRFDGSVKVLDLGSHSANISLSDLHWYSGSWPVVDGSTAYYIPVLVDSSNKKHYIGTKALTINLSTGVTNWDSITTFTELKDFTGNTYYIGSDSSYHYFILQGEGNDVTNSRLLKMNKSTYSITTSNLLYRNMGADQNNDLRIIGQRSGRRATTGLINNAYICIYAGVLIDVTRSEYIMFPYYNPNSIILYSPYKTMSSSISLWNGGIGTDEYINGENKTYANPYGGTGAYHFAMQKLV